MRNLIAVLLSILLMHAWPLHAADKVVLNFPALDMSKIAAEDAAPKSKPPRFAIARDVQFVPGKQGNWTETSDGRSTWRLQVNTPDAVHLNFGFSRFKLPESAQLLIRSNDGKGMLGPFTARDNSATGQLWTQILPGTAAEIELSVDTVERARIDLLLSRVGHGYRGFGFGGKLCKSGTCNMDVACLAGNDPWNEQRRSVAAITVGGTDTCTGALINNTRGDRRLLFATASHCVITGANVGQVLAYFNYESPSCRTPGSAASGQVVPKPNTTLAGLAFLAATDTIGSPFPGNVNTRSDWTLLELRADPDPIRFANLNLFWAGWDRDPPPTNCSQPFSPSATDGLCASIHHPSVHEKRITFVQTPMQRDDYRGGTGLVASQIHWRADWDPTPPILPNIINPPATLTPGVTEPGSSGSPLFNANRRLIGVLSGGASFCGVSPAGLNDQYGGLFHAWDGLGTPTTRVRDYLDPLGTNPTSLNGITQNASGAISALNVSKVGTGSGTVTSNPAGINCGATCSANFTTGTQVTLTATAAGGSTFAGWSGDCAGTGTCTVTMSQTRNATANFTGGGGGSTVLQNGVPVSGLSGALGSNLNFTIPIPAGASNLVIRTAGGSGDPDLFVRFGQAPTTTTFDCRSELVGPTEQCTFATPSAGTYHVLILGFTAYSGVTLTATWQVTQQNQALAVSKIGSGGGTVTSNPAGINCGATCSASFASGTVVALSAAAAGGSAFIGWAGCDSTSGASCSVTMNAARNVSATFNLSGGGGTVLQNGVPLSNLSGAQLSSSAFTVVVPSGAQNLVIRTSGGSGDPDLYVRFGAPATTATFNCSSTSTTPTEQCTFAVPSAGTHHILIYGFGAYSGLTLTASWQTAGGTLAEPVAVVNLPLTTGTACAAFYSVKTFGNPGIVPGVTATEITLEGNDRRLVGGLIMKGNVLRSGAFAGVTVPATPGRAVQLAPIAFWLPPDLGAATLEVVTGNTTLSSVRLPARSGAQVIPPILLGDRGGFFSVRLTPDTLAQFGDRPFAIELGVKFLDNTSAFFDSGTVVGGVIDGNNPTEVSFCMAISQNVKIRTLGFPTYGDGVTGQFFTIRNPQDVVVFDSRNP